VVSFSNSQKEIHDMLRKQIWLLALLLTAAMVLAACPAAPAPGGAPADAPAQEEAAAEDTDAEDSAAEEAPVAEGACAPATDGELAGVDPSGQTVVWWHNHSGEREEGLNTLIEQFNSENECGITVEGQNQGGYGDIREKVNAGIAAGEVPAALLVGYQNDQAFYQLNGALVDFNVFVNDPTWGLTEEEIADFYPAFWEQGEHAAFDNQRLGFPPNRSEEMLYYNQTWLEELGYDAPPSTPEEFREIACAAAEAKGDGTGGYVLREDASAVAAWTYAFGGDILNEDGTGYVVNGPATVEALTFLQQLYNDGCAFFFTEGYPETQLAARNAIFTQGSSSGIPFYQIAFDDAAAEAGRDADAWGVTAVPHTTPDPVQNIYGGDVMIPVTSPEQELAAWLFVKWFTTPEVQAQWTGISGYFPTRASAPVEEYIASEPYGEQWAQALELLPYGTYEPQLISYEQVRNRLEQDFNAIMQGEDVQATLDAANEFANQVQEELMAEVQ
jgi:multiple sugar transport system substrate-binding protein/sn-glycerol 3-phosphate transport system substrate-binding protein